MRRTVFFFTHNHIFLHSVYSLQVQLQVISFKSLVTVFLKNVKNGIYAYPLLQITYLR